MKKIGGRPEGGAQVSIARTMKLAGRFPNAPAFLLLVLSESNLGADVRDLED
jgi:hypothetical protein